MGKSTILKETLEKLHMPLGGFTTKRVLDGPFRTYLTQSLYDDRREVTIARVDSRDWSKEVFEEAFSKDLVSILDHSFANRDLIVLDELGFMESHIEPFTSKVYELLDSDKIIFGVLKDYDCEFLNTIRARNDIELIKVTEENRDWVVEETFQILKSIRAKTPVINKII